MFSNSFGLDISDESLKFVELVTTKNGIQVGRHGEHKLSPDIIESGKIKDPKRLKEILTSLKKNFGLKSVHISLPNESVENVKDYPSVFKSSKITVKSFVPQIQALANSVIEKSDKGTTMIINLGQKDSAIGIVSGGIVVFCFAVRSGTISLLRDEVAKHFINWHTHKDKEEKMPSIKKIILCGDIPNLTDFAEYLSVSLRNKVEVANVWVNILDTSNHIPEISFKQSFDFAPALGLALSGFNR